MTKRTLTYFAIRGRAEPIRLLLEEVALPYEERPIASQAEWAKIKPAMPFGQVPLLEEDGVAIPQARAILRHLARENDLCGKTDRERFLADIAAEAFADAEDAFWGARWQKDPNRVVPEYAAGPLVATHAQLECHFREVGGDYWAGAVLTFADFIAFKYLDMMAALHPASLDACPELQAFAARIAARSRIAAHLSSGRRSRVISFSINGPVFDPRD